MLTVHHLNNSRSQRIIWLLEELGVDYQIKSYQRDPVTSLAPPELEAVHPLGKSPVLTDGDVTVIESGAIIDYLLRHYGGGQLLPSTGSNDHEQYLQWLHYGESGAVLPLMLKLDTSKLPDGGEVLKPRISEELTRHLGYIEQSLEGVSWFVGDTFSGALCVAVSEGKSVVDAVKFAAKASAITVTRMGAQSSIPSLSELTTQE